MTTSTIPSIVGSSKRSKRVQFFLLCLFIPLFTIPFYVVLSASFKTSQGADVTTMWKLPAEWTTSGISKAWEALSGNFKNSLFMVIPAVVISSLIGSFNGFILSKYKFKFSNTIFTLMLVGMFIPYQTILIPMVRFLQLVHLYGSLPGLALVHIIYGIPITTLMFRNFYVSVPKALVEAASIDGAGLLKTFFRIILPLSIPGFVVAGIYQFTNIWNDFLFGIVTIPNPVNQPVTAALNNLSGTQTVDWNVLMAGSLIAALPTAIMYLLLGRYYIQGLTSGSVK
jgi:glucose/mannose transport system permease protein